MRSSLGRAHALRSCLTKAAHSRNFRRMVACLSLMMLPLSGCSPDSPVGPSAQSIADVAPAVVDSGKVTDLQVSAISDSSITLAWTEVDDGSGLPASYRLKYAQPPIDWASAAIGCDRTITGVRIGAPMSCTVHGLSQSTEYDFQLMSYRTLNGVWVGSVYSNLAHGTTIAPPSTVVTAGVSDLAIVASSETTVAVRWTQVDDGTGAPAKYRVKYAPPSIDYASATVGCQQTIVGTAIGDPISCTIEGLAPGTKYEVQLMSYRTDASGAWQDPLPSNIVAAETVATTPVAQASAQGIWISPAELAALPTSGAAWSNLLSEANSSCGSVDLSDQEQRTNVCILAKALAFARTGTASYRSAVVTALKQIVDAPAYNGRALALGRELGAYVIAADLISLRSHDPALDRDFRAEIRSLLTTYTNSGPSSLIKCHELRPNNWGTHCGASRLAVAAYLGDTAEIDRAAQVFKGWLGDRSAYAGFVYGDLSWQCDPNRPVGINPAGCRRYSRDLGGILPDDQRRAGSYSWPPTRENYVWEALQGAVVQAVILERLGYPAFQWSDQALRRAVEWLYTVNGFPAGGDDGWQPHLFNRYYGTSFSAPVPANAGKNVGWTDWTHR